MNPLRDQNGGKYVPGERMGNTCDHGLSIEKRWGEHLTRVGLECRVFIENKHRTAAGCDVLAWPCVSLFPNDIPIPPGY